MLLCEIDRFFLGSFMSQIEFDIDDTGNVLSVGGRLDAAANLSFQVKMQGWEGSGDLILNLMNLEYINSAALRVIITKVKQLGRTVGGAERKLLIAAPNDPDNPIHTLDGVVKIFGTLAAAQESLNHK